MHSWIYVVDAENSCAAYSPAASPASLLSVASDPIVNTLPSKGLENLAIVKREVFITFKT